MLITTTRVTQYHGWLLPKGKTLEAEIAEGGFTVAHPRVAGARVHVPAVP